MFDQNVQNLLDISMHLSRQDITHFLIGGTLLGAVRDGKLIENDKDLDLGVYANTPKQLHYLYNAMRQLEILNFSVAKFYETVITIDRGYRADIFNIYEGSKFYYLKLGDWRMDFPVECFKTLSTISLYGKTFNIPSNSELLLEQQYGENWRTPNPDFKLIDCKNLKKC